MDVKSKDKNYPSSLDLLNLCGLPLPAQYQTEETQKLKHQLDLQAEEVGMLKEKLDHLINVQIQTSKQINELKDIILQTSGASQTVVALLSIDDRQSMDNLLADEDGQDMEQEEIKVQHLVQNVGQGFEVDGVPPPQPADDELRAPVDNLMVDMQDQE